MNDPKKFLIGASCLAPQKSLCGFVTDFRFRHKFAFRFTLSTFDRLGLAPARLTVDDELCTPELTREHPTTDREHRSTNTPHRNQQSPHDTPPRTKQSHHRATEYFPQIQHHIRPTRAHPQLMGVLWDGHTLAPPHPNTFVGDRSYTRVLEHWAPSNLTDENVKGKTHTLAVADFSMIQACALHHSAEHQGHAIKINVVQPPTQSQREGSSASRITWPSSSSTSGRRTLPRGGLHGSPK